MKDERKSASTRKASDLRFLQAVQAIQVREGFKNNSQFLAAHGWNHALLNKIRAGLQSAPSEVLTVLAERYKLNLNYIFLGLEPMFIDGLVPQMAKSSYQVPFLPARAMATFAETYLNDFDYTQLSSIEYISDVPPTKGAIAIEVEGDSMAEQLHPGSIILCVPVNQDDLKYLNSGVYTIIYGNHLVVKRIKNNDLLQSGTLTLHSDNPKHGSVTIMGEDIRHVWKVDQILKGVVR